MGAKHLTGTPWHTERMHREEGDERRDKRYCEFYNPTGNKCSKRNGWCIGSSHCDDYERTSEEEHQRRLAARRPKKNAGEDDVFWYN